MKKFIENFENIFSQANLWKAWVDYRKGKRNRQSVAEYEYRLEENLTELYRRLKNNTYESSPYRKFIVFDPKKRVISAPGMADRIVHRALYNALYPFYDRLFMACSFSCREGKGLSKALGLTQSYLKSVSQNYHCKIWVLHFDIKKCFDSIDHLILKQFLRQRIHCQKTIQILEKIIYGYHTAESKGIPLGSLTSQLFINIYLDPLDRFVKEKLKIKHYLRYADDSFIFFRDRKECQKWLVQIGDFLKINLKLSIPPDHYSICNLNSGVKILGWKFVNNYSKIKAESVSQMKSKFAQRVVEYKKDSISASKLNASWQSYRGILVRGKNLSTINQFLAQIL